MLIYDTVQQQNNDDIYGNNDDIYGNNNNTTNNDNNDNTTTNGDNGNTSVVITAVLAVLLSISIIYNVVASVWIFKLQKHKLQQKFQSTLE